MQEREREESKRALSPNLTPQVNQMGLVPLCCAVWQLIDIHIFLVVDITNKHKSTTVRGRSLERHLKYFGLVDDSGKAISFPEWATLAQDRAGWLQLVTKVPFGIGKPQLRPPRCDTRATPEEKRRFLARRAQETEQQRALFNAETDAEET